MLLYLPPCFEIKTMVAIINHLRFFAAAQVINDRAVVINTVLKSLTDTEQSFLTSHYVARQPLEKFYGEPALDEVRQIIVGGLHKFARIYSRLTTHPVCMVDLLKPRSSPSNPLTGSSEKQSELVMSEQNALRHLQLSRLPSTDELFEALLRRMENLNSCPLPMEGKRQSEACLASWWVLAPYTFDPAARISLPLSECRRN
jgi:hypothetical protein